MGKKLYSKRNQVFDCGIYIKKIHRCSQKAQEEKNNLQLLDRAGVPVAKVWFCFNKNLYLKKIAGPNMVQCLESQVLAFSDMPYLAQELVSWLAKFYAAVNENVILEDVNLRNFMVTDQGIVGVDFESFAQGEKEKNIAEILCFIKNYDIEEKVKHSFYQEFYLSAMHTFVLDKDKLDVCGVKAQETLEQRRQKHKPH